MDTMLICNSRSSSLSALYLFLLLSSKALLCAATEIRKCQQRYYEKKENIVCVCNATYCDDVPEVGNLQQLQAAIFKTSQYGKRFERTSSSFTEKTNVLKSGKLFVESRIIRLKIDGQIRFQTIIGFGGAFTDAAGININLLSESTRFNLLQSYFGNTGIQYTIGRVPIASTDFSTHVYSYDDSPNDFTLSNFSLTEEDFKFKIPYIKQAVSLTGGVLKLFASPWSAPGWMKTSGKMVGGGALRGPSDGPYHVTWANHYVKFLEAYKNNGVTFWGLTIQNEPVAGVDLSYKWQAMYFSPKTERDFIKNHLGPALRRSEVGRNISLMIMDDQRTQLPIWADVVFVYILFMLHSVVLKDKEAAQYVSGIAVHWYNDFIPVSQLSETHNRHPNKFIFGTEAEMKRISIQACNGFKPFEHTPLLGDWSRGDMYAHDIIQDLSHWVSGWTDWNLCLDLKGGPNFAKNYVDAPIIVNATADEFYKQPMFYIMGHFSKFIPPGSARIELHFYVKPVAYEGVALVTPTHQRVLILLNRSNKSLTFSIEDRAKDGLALRMQLEPKSIATVVWNK
uniref:Glucosylceramidase n=1 Tax=Elaeophora elaphi TaxID=1147741 RepID=A0A0R3RWK4_9BILA